MSVWSKTWKTDLFTVEVTYGDDDTQFYIDLTPCGGHMDVTDVEQLESVLAAATRGEWAEEPVED